MRTLFGTCSCVVASAALTFACGGSGGAKLVGPTSLVGPTPTAEAAPTLDLSGSWRGTFNQSRVGRGYPPESYRGGTLRLSLIQSGTQVSGTGYADHANSCMPSSFVVTGSVSGASFSLNLTESASAGLTVYAYGVVVGGELDATLSSSRTSCQEWSGNSSLNREQ
jgi:hypothetical protein